ncbi:hypothetical protein LL038_06095 [Clostridium estertheticum]|uniref:Uncharacterized protein n=1 Tax=Clostridium estertheticum TaxID=238834 RepID=A0AA47EKB8_9CLOT|nr:hypothetical protein [Clostridium estertheticum]MBU3157557.1 hypothetical protein [Clostridium estertheticum]WAG61814.1 hypothetical protein LL038_06095 [Clostridium estertheticum]
MFKIRKRGKKDVKVFYARFRTSGARAVDDAGSKFHTKKQRGNSSPWIWEGGSKEKILRY